jgi:hypothetical protein
MSSLKFITIDLGSGSGYPQSALSNFSQYKFEFEGVECNSMEGLLQSFKFDKEHIQIEVCKLVGKGAKFRGKKRNKVWKRTQTLYWKVIPYKRDSEEYQLLITSAFNALFSNEKFKSALKATNNAGLTHSMGKNKESETILTEREFISQLNRLRNLL